MNLVTVDMFSVRTWSITDNGMTKSPRALGDNGRTSKGVEGQLIEMESPQGTA